MTSGGGPPQFERPTIQRQILLYALVGGAQLLVDWCCFVLLTMLKMDVVPANICGRVVGAALGFWLNGKLTFRHTGSRMGPRQAGKFLLSWLTMTGLSTSAVWGIGATVGIGGARIAKPFVDALLAAMGFLASKFWIYR